MYDVIKSGDREMRLNQKEYVLMRDDVQSIIIDDLVPDNSSKPFLILKSEPILIDAGMPHTGEQLVENIKRVLGDTPLRYIFASHSHYDHIGGIPYLRKAWPDVVVFGSKHAYDVLNKQSAKDYIRMMAESSAKFFGCEHWDTYSDGMLKIDRVLHDGDAVEFNDCRITAVETTGHTNCSMAFVLDDEILFTSETLGIISLDGNYFAEVLTSYIKTTESINKCRSLKLKYIVATHYGLLDERETANYWDKSLAALQLSRDFIFNLSDSGYGAEDIIRAYNNPRFRDAALEKQQAIISFDVNTRHLVNTILRERAMIEKLDI